VFLAGIAVCQERISGMNLANMAAGGPPWTALGPLPTGADLSLQLGFALPAPMEPPGAPPAGPPAAWSWTNEPRDSARQGAELAALLVILQPVECGAPPIPAPDGEAGLPLASHLPPSEWLML
jgi:hypothetical protein